METVVNRWLLACLFLCLQSGLLAVDSQSASIELPFIRVESDPSAPLVAIEVWVQAGSASETRETSGAAHLLEHLIFKGTAQHPPGALDAAVESAGGILEASTERDWTRYRMAILPERWEPALRMLMEHLLHPALPEAELRRERELILQDEYALHRADPIRTARYALYAQMYGEHPYALPSLGIPDSLTKLSREQLLEFHARYYRPERMVIVVVGPVEPERVKEAILSAYGTFTPPPPGSPRGRGELSAVPLPVNGEGQGREGSDEQEAARLPAKDAVPELLHLEGEILAMGVMAPPASQPDAMLAAEVIRLALAEPHIGLLWASSPWLIVNSEYTPRLQSGLMLFFFQPYPEAEDGWQQQVRQRWEALVRQILEGKARPLLEWAKQRLITRHQQAMRNPLERARLYAFYATLGLPNLPDEYASRLQSLTAEQIEKVAQAIFEGNQKERTVPPINRGDLQEGVRTYSPPPKQESLQGESSIFRQTLVTGVRVIALRQPGAKQVVLQVLIVTGPDAERDFPPGTSELTARMLFTTTRNETEASLAYRIARSGGSLQLNWEPIGVRIVAIAEPATIENVLSLLKEGLTRAEFTPDALKNALQAALAERRRTDSTHELPLYEALFRPLYHASLYAPAEQLQRVRLEDIKAFYRHHYRHDRFVMVIAGDLPVERLTELMQRYFGTADEAIIFSARQEPRPPGSARQEPRPPVDFTVKALSHPSNAPTLYIGFGLRMPVRSPEEYAALLALQAMLCEGKSCALFRQFREAEGIGYAFGGSAIVWGGEGALLGFLQLGANRASKREELLNHLQAMLRQPSPSPDALNRALALVEGRWRRDQLDIFERTRRLALAEASGVGYLAEEQLPELLKKVRAELFQKLHDWVVQAHLHAPE